MTVLMQKMTYLTIAKLDPVFKTKLIIRLEKYLKINKILLMEKKKKNMLKKQFLKSLNRNNLFKKKQKISEQI